MKRYILITSLVIVTLGLNGQEFKSVGYFPHYRFSKLQDVDFTKLTHVNISFANPDMAGNIMLGDGADISQAVEVIHDAGAEVYIALAGGYLKPEWEAAWDHNMVEERRSAFIHKIVEYVQDNGLDGVDMDLEWQHVNELYSPFVLELSDSLQSYDIPFTAALPGTYRYPDISDEALLVFDWVNMMAYDLRGPWAPELPGPHSPYSFAVSSMNYWRSQGVESSRLTLGLPFYGYDFTNPTDTDALTYNQIVNMNPDNAEVDQAGEIYYNGIPTIKEKTLLAMEELAGIMIWELGQDHFGEFSLLSAIHETISGGASSITQSESLDLDIFPNPFQDRIRIRLKEKSESCSVQIFTSSGLLVHNKRYVEQGNIDLNTSQLQKGAYAVKITTGKANQTFMLVK